MKEALRLKSLILPEPERRAFLEEIRVLLPAPLYERIRQILELVGLILTILEGKILSIAKLKQLCFGASMESARNVYGAPAADKPKIKKAKGHGRHSHRHYTGAKRVPVAHGSLKPGQECPDCKKGKLRRRARPAIALQVTAEPPVGAVVYEMESLRCDTCGKVFTAQTPPEATREKYDASVGVMVGLMRYGSGMPFYRLERLQESLGVPLPSSIQWEQAHRSAQALEPLLDHLIYLGAQSSLVYNDDTTMRVGQLRQEIKAEVDPERTGIFTSGIVCEAQNHPIILFFTGRAHAGENLARVLDHREPGLAPPLHMGDGLSRNNPKGHATQPCNCNVHARRNFVDIRGSFPEECRRVVESFAEIYRVEAQVKADQLSPEKRLALHQTQSQPVMEKLKTWFTDLLSNKKVEPNSRLGQAIDYMQDRWEPLTQFLRIPGAPIDNNVTERMLKMSILHRKNSLHYRTARGASVGDLFMSLIQTCRANHANPFDYLLAVVRNPKEVIADPGLWMPWNYPKPES